VDIVMGVVRVVTEDARMVVTECANCGLVWAPRFHGPWPGSPCSRCRRPVTEREHLHWDNDRGRDGCVTVR